MLLKPYDNDIVTYYRNILFDGHVEFSNDPFQFSEVFENANEVLLVTSLGYHIVGIWIFSIERFAIRRNPILHL